jgi:hypothetical protein
MEGKTDISIGEEGTPWQCVFAFIAKIKCGESVSGVS